MAYNLTTDRKLAQALKAVERARKELTDAASYMVGLGHDCWLQRDAMKLANECEDFAAQVELFKQEVAR